MEQFGPEKWHPITAKELGSVALDGLKWVFSQFRHENLSDRFVKPHSVPLPEDSQPTEIVEA